MLVKTSNKKRTEPCDICEHRAKNHTEAGCMRCSCMRQRDELEAMNV